jgi:linoleoyl-CoA desaturase
MHLSTVSPPIDEAPRPPLSELWRASLPTEGELRRGRRRLRAKAVGIAGLLAVAYWAVVIADFAVWVRLLSAVALVAGLVATATGIMHDANHGSFSKRRWVNRSLAATADLLGTSSWLWRFKHHHLHHGNTNVAGVDSDIAQEPFARLEPSQRWRPWHRWQHVYLWFLYGFFAMKNVLFGDLRNLASGRVGHQPLATRPSRSRVLRIAGGKVAHVGWAVVVPLAFNPWWGVLAFYVCCSWVVGFSLAVVFQLAHCVDVAEFAEPDQPRRGEEFLAHQVRTTVDIDSPVPGFGHAFRWLVGGLDHQLEHHLAPSLPHTVYPAVARRFRRRCDQAGVMLRRHAGVWAAVRSHQRWLISMGRSPSTVGLRAAQ